MSLTESNMLPLGTLAPKFELKDVVSDKMISIDELTIDKGLLIMFICNHCPYVIHLHDEIKTLTDEYAKKGIYTIAISSNDISKYPQDRPELMKKLIEDKQFNFPYLYDASQDVAKSYMAACTPDFYVFDQELKCFYRGRMDDSSPGNGKSITGKDLRNALDNLIAREPGPELQLPSMGCNIKWI